MPNDHISALELYPVPGCMTSGAIQQGVPTKYVPSLDIPMNMSLSVKIIQSLKSFLKNGSDSSLFESIGIGRFHAMQAGTLRHERHDYPEVAVNYERRICPKNIRCSLMGYCCVHCCFFESSAPLLWCFCSLQLCVP
ncbi:hypothetical protein QQP08_020893 [Theobroma cacao]|nr:hypothetical protein QQP08_020893 [Theobroma cacao]